MADKQDSNGVGREPKLERPEGYSDSEWLLLKACRNEQVVARINSAFADPSILTPEEAAALLECVSGAERVAVTAIIRLRRSVAPKVASYRATANALRDIKMVLFDVATRV